jgi:UDP-N-acetyl-D-glucosamine dehydrogenase
VGVIGVAFKPNVRDQRNSPAAAILALLTERGATVSYHDPHVPEFRDDAGKRRESTPLTDLIAGADVVVIVTAHAAVDWDTLFVRAPLIVDTVNASKRHEPAPRQVLRLGAGWS